MKRVVALLLLTAVLAGLASCKGAELPVAGKATDPVPADKKSSADSKASQAEEGVLVESLEQLIAAIRPGAVLLIPQQGLLIPAEASFASDGSYGEETAYVGWDFIDYETNLVIRNVDGLTIRGADGQTGTLLSDNPFAFVLCFENCANIRIERVVAGHEVQGSCMGGVFHLRDCKDVSIADSELYGCGTVGLVLEDVNGLSVENSSIYDCTYALMTVEDSSNLHFLNTDFHDTGTYSDTVSITEGRRILFEGCAFYNNYTNVDYGYQSRLFRADEASREIKVERCSFTGNALPLLTDSQRIRFEDCSLERNAFDREGSVAEDGIWLPAQPDDHGEIDLDDTASSGSGERRYVNLREGYDLQYLSSITLYESGLFSFRVNLIQGMGYLSGSYVEEGSTLRLTATHRDFSEFPGDGGFAGDDITEFLFTLEEEGLVYATGRQFVELADGERFTRFALG